MEHFSCFPNLGKIMVHGLMVKKKSFLYHLSDSTAIKHVLKELSGTWLLHLDASSMQNAAGFRSSAPFTLKSVGLNVTNYRRLSPISNDCTTRNNAKSDYSRKNLKKRNIIEHNNPVEANKWTKNREVKSGFAPSFNTEHQLDTVLEDPIEGEEHESLSILESSGKNNQSISVTAIISRFFSELDEVHVDELRDSKIRTLTDQERNTTERAKVALKVKKQQLGSKKQVNKKSSHCTSDISSRIYVEASRSKSCKYQVGKRLVQAANSIQIAGNGRRSATKFLSKFRNLTSSDSALFARKFAFDVDDFTD